MSAERYTVHRHGAPRRTRGVGAATPAISVVVPTRDRPEPLARCLAALEAQTVGDLEIVVVDDGSADHPAVAAAVSTAPRARLLTAGGRGPAAARNLGAAEARAPVVCFTDDDCAPHPTWAASLAAAIAGGADAAAGRARSPRHLGPGAAAWEVICDHLTDSGHDAATGRVAFGPTCTLAARAATLARVPFDERYPLAAGEDRDWCARLTASGGALVLAPEAIVAHHHPLPPRAFWRQQINYGRGAYRFRAAHARRPERPRFYATLLARAARRGPRVAALAALAQVAAAAGLAAEALSARRPKASATSS